MPDKIIDRRALVAGLAAAPTAAIAAPKSSKGPNLAALHERMVVVDTHIDFAPNMATPFFDPSKSNGRQFTLPGMVKGGVDAAFFIVYVDQGPRNAAGYETAAKAAMAKFDAIKRLTTQYSRWIGLAGSPAEVAALRAQGRRAALIGVENGFPLGRDLANVAKYQALGTRYITLVHNGHNDIGDSAQPQASLGDRPAEHGGLSAFGRKFVAEMNRTGIMVDVSHAAKSTMMDAAEVSKAPLLASHSGVRALVDHPRNMDDEQLRVMKAKGGVVQITAVDEFLKKSQPARDEAIEALKTQIGMPAMTYDDEPHLLLPPFLLKRWLAGMAEIDRRWPGAGVKELVDHIDHAVKIMGVDHVGIASDFGGGGGISGWNRLDDTPAVTRELLARGYGEAEIYKIWGGNVMRVLDAVQATARG